MHSIDHCYIDLVEPLQQQLAVFCGLDFEFRLALHFYRVSIACKCLFSGHKWGVGSYGGRISTLRTLAMQSQHFYSSGPSIMAPKPVKSSYTALSSPHSCFAHHSGVAPSMFVLMFTSAPCSTRSLIASM
jgi:hypothetical protein